MKQRETREKELKGLKRILYIIFVKDFWVKVLALLLAGVVWLVAAGLTSPAEWNLPL